MDANSSEDDDNDAIASTVFIVLVLLICSASGINSWGRSNSDEIGGVICRHYVLLVTKILVIFCDSDGCVSKYTPRIEVPWGMGNERHFLKSLSIKGSYY